MRVVCAPDSLKGALAAGDAALARAQILEQLQKKEEALAAYELVIERYGAGQRLATALLGAAQLHAQLGHHAKAAELYQRLLREFPDFAQKDAALYQLAWALHDDKQTAAAEQAFRLLYLEHRGSRFWGDATFRTANAAFAAGRHEEAGRLAEELLASRPQGDVLAHALLLQGRAAAAQEKWPAAHPPLERLIKSFPESKLRPAAEYYLAEAIYQQGQYEEATKRFAALSPRLAGQSESWVAMVPLRHAQSLAHLQRWAEAQRIAEGIAAGAASTGGFAVVIASRLRGRNGNKESDEHRQDQGESHGNGEIGVTRGMDQGAPGAARR